MLNPLSMGPINAGLLLICFLIMVGCVFFTLRRVHRGEPAPIVAVAIGLLLPLILAAWAGTWQHDAGTRWAMEHANEAYRQTYLAQMLARTLATQLYAGLVVVSGGVALLAGALALTVRGERPRWLAGWVGAGLGAVLVSVSAVSMLAFPGVTMGIRVVCYAVLVVVCVVALVAAHRRGPGVQLATLVAVVLPSMIVGADLATVASVATSRMMDVAVAAPGADKIAEMADALSTLDLIHASSWVGLAVAILLALLGPVVAWRRERSHAMATVVALCTVVVIAAVGLSCSMHWTLPVRW